MVAETLSYPANAPRSFETSSVLIRKAGVLGAGTMGARIAAHFANAGLPVVLLDIASAQGARSAVAAQALEALRTMHVVDIRVGAEIRRGVTAGNHRARQILAALGINDRESVQPHSPLKMPT